MEDLTLFLWCNLVGMSPVFSNPKGNNMTEIEARMRCEHCLSCIEEDGCLTCDMTGTSIGNIEECPEGVE
jgi:hypothetical protein